MLTNRYNQLPVTIEIRSYAQEGGRLSHLRNLFGSLYLTKLIILTVYNRPSETLAVVLL